MRDVNRIDPFLSKLREVWMKNPDWRFGQLVDNIACRVDCDLFYVEDDIFLKTMLEAYSEDKRGLDKT